MECVIYGSVSLSVCPKFYEHQIDHLNHIYGVQLAAPTITSILRTSIVPWTDIIPKMVTIPRTVIFPMTVAILLYL